MTLSGLINDTPCDSLIGKPYPEPTETQPTDAEVEAMLFDLDCRASDGCDGVDPDGTCCHRHPSWLLRLGLV